MFKEEAAKLQQLPEEQKKGAFLQSGACSKSCFQHTRWQSLAKYWIGLFGTSIPRN